MKRLIYFVCFVVFVSISFAGWKGWNGKCPVCFKKGDNTEVFQTNIGNTNNNGWVLLEFGCSMGHSFLVREKKEKGEYEVVVVSSNDTPENIVMTDCVDFIDDILITNRLQTNFVYILSYTDSLKYVECKTKITNVLTIITNKNGH